jgi:hypothetical protein
MLLYSSSVFITYFFFDKIEHVYHLETSHIGVFSFFGVWLFAKQEPTHHFGERVEQMEFKAPPDQDDIFAKKSWKVSMYPLL